MSLLTQRAAGYNAFFHAGQKIPMVSVALAIIVLLFEPNLRSINQSRPSGGKYHGFVWQGSKEATSTTTNRAKKCQCSGTAILYGQQRP